ncbi:hypothetical protein [Paenibacillus sp. FSL H3-0469]|uniref:hypothetical protein n=1 Tax=Paenibacillus sp. FSL H3-0469 TaxID=2954506 RepID=UPI003100D335
MNNRISKIIKNFSYTLTSNLISMLISVLMVLFIPKIINLGDYSYWQLFIFYTSYVGLFNIGWVEGVYLKYGGLKYSDLNKRIFSTQFWYFTIYIAVISLILVLYIYARMDNFDKKFIMYMVSIYILLTVPRGFLLFVLQATNEIKKFSKIMILDRLLYCLFLVLAFAFNFVNYKSLIYIDLISKIITTIISLIICKEIINLKFVSLQQGLRETFDNIKVGIKLLIANLVGLFIIGLVRLGIERNWNIETFGKISLTMSISNLFMVFINAAGIIMFPLLRQIPEGKLPKMYKTMRDMLMIPLFSLFVLYYPMKEILTNWLPHYAESLKYMALLFPMCIFESKVALLINTYLKTLRKEKLILKANIYTLILTVVSIAITIGLLNDLTTTVISIVFLLAFRCIVSEILLARYLKISVEKDIVLELFMTITFMLVGWILNSISGFFVYVIIYTIYMLLKKKDINKLLILLKSQFNSN